MNLDNCQPEVVSDVISSTVNQDVGRDLCANFGDSRLKPSEASFSALFRTSITSDRKYIVISDVVVDPAGVKFLVKFGDSRSNRSQDILQPHFVTNDDDDDDDDSDNDDAGRRP